MRRVSEVEGLKKKKKELYHLQHYLQLLLLEAVLLFALFFSILFLSTETRAGTCSTLVGCSTLSGFKRGINFLCVKNMREIMHKSSDQVFPNDVKVTWGQSSRRHIYWREVIYPL